jgi:hypothetical protein
VTLDSFFASILRSASLELGLEPDFVTKEQNSQKLDYEFVSQVVASGGISSLVKLALDIEDKRFGKIFEIMQDFYRLDPLLREPDRDGLDIYALEAEIDECRDRLHKILIEAKASKSAIGNFAPTDTKTLSQKSLFGKESLLDHRNYKKYVEQNPPLSIPNHLKSPSPKGYLYPHDFGGYVKQNYLEKELKFYESKKIGFEKTLDEWLLKIKNR